MSIAEIFFLVLTTVVYALLEIQIEGKDGWAAKLPTKKITLGRPWSSFIGSAHRPLTFYHLYLWSFLLVLLHYPLIYVRWSFALELKLLGNFILIATVADWLWFIFNPNFGLKRFTARNIYWFKSWFLGLPGFYFVNLSLIVVFYWLSFTL